MNVYKVHSLDNGGTFAVTEECVFATKQEAHKSYLEESAKLVDKYKEEIKNLNDLLKFPLEYCISCGEEYTDYEAQKAYKIRANELFGIILD
jgi:hypothetical protein